MSNDNPVVPQPRRDPYRLVGEIFDGRYRIEAFVSSGSFGAVYRAVNIRVGKTVAVKVLKPDLKDELAETARELFKREGLTIGNLDHPHIVNIIDVGEEFDFAYMVMEWLEGRTLEAEIKSRKTFTPEDAAKILSDIADALHTAHEQGIIHRDIKPSNIHLGREEKITVKVLDFGIAKVISSASQAMASRIAGTLEYASPEQVSGGMIDRRSDIYSLGVMMYQMLVGELPFKATSEAHLIQMHLMEPPPKLTEKRRDLSEKVSAVIERAMAKQPEDRFQSVLEFNRAFFDSFSGHLYVDSSEMQTLLAVTKASPIETETYTIPKDLQEGKRINVEFADDANHLQTDLSKIKETQETTLPASTQEKSIEQAKRARRKFYALRYALGGALFMFIVRLCFWIDFNLLNLVFDDIEGGVPAVFPDMLLGAFVGVIISEMRPNAWWSVAPHRRLKAFVIYAMTGAAIVFICWWLGFHHFFMTRDLGQILESISEISEINHIYFHNYAQSAEYIILTPIGFILGLVVCTIKVALYRETENKKNEIVSPETDKSYTGIYLIIGGAVLFFIVSLIVYFVTRGISTGEYQLYFYRVFHDTILGVALGAIVGQLIRPSARWSVTDGYQGKSVLLHGFSALFVLFFMDIIQGFFYSVFNTISMASESEHSPSVIQGFLVGHYRVSPIFVFRYTILYFVIGVLIWLIRNIAHKTNRPGLVYTLGGALCGFMLSYFSWLGTGTPYSTQLSNLLLNVLIGAMFFASISELRKDSRWSVKKGQSVKAFLIHGATGITILMGLGWVISSLGVVILFKIDYISPTVNIILAILALIGFIVGLVVCGARLAIGEALSVQKTT